MHPARFLSRPNDDGDLRLAPFFFRVDPVADSLIARFDSMAPGAGWAALESALRGEVMPKDAPSELRALIEASEYVPAWVDWRAVERAGPLLFRAGLFGGLVLGYKSLVLGYCSSGGNKPLVFSGRLEGQAPRRLAETSRFVQTVCSKGGLQRFAPGYAISVKVRLMHAQVRALLWQSGRWDKERWGEPINQHDMAATLLLFSYVFILGLREVGFRVTEDEAEDYTHLFRYVGHLLGVDPELAPPSFRDAARLAERIEATQGPPDDDARALTRALLAVGPLAAQNESERRRALQQQPMIYALCRHFVGEDRARGLHLARTRWDHAVPVLIRAVKAAEELRLRSPRVAAWMRRQGEEYWETVISRGAATANYAFSPPERLARG